MLGRLRRRTSNSRKDRPSHLHPQSHTTDNSLEYETRRPIDSPLSDRGVHMGWSSRPRLLSRNSSSYDNKTSRLFRRRGTDIADENDNPARMTPTSSKSQLSAPWQSGAGSLFFRPKLANAKQHATHTGSRHGRSQSTFSSADKQNNVRRSQSNGQLNNDAGLITAANGSAATAAPPPPMTKDDEEELHRILAAVDRPSMGNQRAQGGPAVSPAPFRRFTREGEYENNSYLIDSLYDGQSKGLGITLSSGDSNRQRMRRYETPPESPPLGPPPPPRSRNVSSPRMRTKSREPSPGREKNTAPGSFQSHESSSASTSPSSHRKPIPPRSRSQSEEREEKESRNALQMAANAASGTSGASSIPFYPSPQTTRRAESSGKSTSSQQMEILKPSDFSSPNSSSRAGQTSPTRRRGLSAGAKTPNSNTLQSPLNRKISLPNETLARNGEADAHNHHQQQQRGTSPSVPSQLQPMKPLSPRGGSQPSSPAPAGVPFKRDTFQPLHDVSTAAAPSANANANVDTGESTDHRPPLVRASSGPPPIPVKSSSRPSSAGSNSSADEQPPPSRPGSSVRRKIPPRFEHGALSPHKLRNASSSPFRQPAEERSFDPDMTPTAERLMSFSPVGAGASGTGGAAGSGSGVGPGPSAPATATASGPPTGMVRPNNRRYPSYERKRGLLLRQEAHERRLVVLLKRYNAKVQEACNVIVEASLRAEQSDRRRSVSLSLRPSNVNAQPQDATGPNGGGGGGDAPAHSSSSSPRVMPPNQQVPSMTTSTDDMTNLDRAELPSPILNSLRARREETVVDLHNLSFEKRGELLPCLLAHLVHRHFHQEVVKTFCYGADVKSNTSAMQLVESLQSQVPLPTLHRLTTHLHSVLQTTTNTSTSQKQTQSTTLTHLQTHLSTLIYWAGLCKRKSDAAMFIARAYGRLRDALGVLAEVVRCARGDTASSPSAPPEGSAPTEMNNTSSVNSVNKVSVGPAAGAGVRWYEVREGISEGMSSSKAPTAVSASRGNATTSSLMSDDSLVRTDSETTASTSSINSEQETMPSTAPTSSSSTTPTSPLVGLTTHLMLTVIKVPSSGTSGGGTVPMPMQSQLRNRSAASVNGRGGGLPSSSSASSSRQRIYDESDSDIDADDEVVSEHRGGGSGFPNSNNHNAQHQQHHQHHPSSTSSLSNSNANSYTDDAPESQSHFSDDTLSASSSLSQDESSGNGEEEEASDSEHEQDLNVTADDSIQGAGAARRGGGGQRSMPTATAMAAAPPPSTTTSTSSGTGLQAPVQEPEQPSAVNWTYEEYIQRGARVVLG